MTDNPPPSPTSTDIPARVRKPYDTDMSDKEWTVYQAFFPPFKGLPGRNPPKYECRDVLNALRYMERTGCQWRNLPHDFPPWESVAAHFYRWRKQGRFEAFREFVTLEERRKAGRSLTPTAGAMDSQAVKTTEAGGAKGFSKEKATKGRKRFVFVDILGLLLAVLIVPASVQDRDGGAELLRRVHATYPSIVKVFVDTAFNSTPMSQASTETGIDVERSAKPAGEPGFVPIPKRWVVERFYGWINRSRRLSKDYERTIESSQAWLDLASARLGTHRLMHGTTSFRTAVSPIPPERAG